MTLLPPPQYDVPPPMPVIEHVLTHAEVNALYNQAYGPGQVNGFAFSRSGTCVIIRIDDPMVARHERAHCAGWPADHPGGWYDIYTNRR